MPGEPQDWAAVADGLLAGERNAVLKVSRLIASLLVRWRAYDFRDEWPDLVQDVLLAVIDGLRKGRVQRPEALVGYVAAIARFKLADRLRTLRAAQAAGVVPPSDAAVPDSDPFHPPAEAVTEVRLLLAKLPDAQRAVVVGVYGEGRTYEAVARETGIPLGTVKRYLRIGGWLAPPDSPSARTGTCT